MDIVTLTASIISSLGISVLAVTWLAKELIKHRLGKDLEYNRTALKQDLEKQKSEWQGQIKKEVEEYLGEKAAEREYILDAKKRLYSVIGPLRFQLLIACRDMVGRLTTHSEKNFQMELSHYYGKSMIYRILKPLSISQLIENQISYADFSIDPSAIALLQFKRAAFSAFTGRRPIIQHSKANWNEQTEHIFYDNLNRASNALLFERNETVTEIIQYQEFEEQLKNSEFYNQLYPLTEIINDFDLKKQPVFWLRLVCYGYICNEFIKKVGKDIGFEIKNYRVAEMIELCNDSEIISHLNQYESVFHEVSMMKL